MLTRGYRNNRDRWMPRQNRAKLLAGISIGTDDRYWDLTTHRNQAAAIEAARVKRSSVRFLPSTTNIS